jgi:hypothetical protein
MRIIKSFQELEIGSVGKASAHRSLLSARDGDGDGLMDCAVRRAIDVALPVVAALRSETRRFALERPSSRIVLDGAQKKSRPVVE